MSLAECGEEGERGEETQFHAFNSLCIWETVYLFIQRFIVMVIGSH